jgi:hypothetical protein
MAHYKGGFDFNGGYCRLTIGGDKTDVLSFSVETVNNQLAKLNRDECITLAHLLLSAAEAMKPDARTTEE